MSERLAILLGKLRILLGLLGPWGSLRKFTPAGHVGRPWQIDVQSPALGHLTSGSMSNAIVKILIFWVEHVEQ